MTKSKIAAFLKKNPRFVGSARKQDFGKLTFGGFDYKGEKEGRWYSVDNNG